MRDDDVLVVRTEADAGRAVATSPTDMVFRQGGGQLLLDAVPAPDGFRGLFEVGMEVA